LELCGWLTTGLAGPDGKQDVDKKNISVVMLLKAPMIRKKEKTKAYKRKYMIVFQVFLVRKLLELYKKFMKKMEQNFILKQMLQN